MTQSRHHHPACCLLALLLLLAGCAAPTKLDYAQARAKAQVDEESLTESQRKAAAEATEAVLNDVEDQCHFVRTGFSYVFRLNSQGTIRQMWSDDINATAACLYKALGGKKLFVPPRAPFYTFVQWVNAPTLLGRTLLLGMDDTSQPVMDATGILTENKGQFTLGQLKVHFAGNPEAPGDEPVTIRSLRLRLSHSLDNETESRACEFGPSPRGWACGFAGPALPVNLVLRRGETVTLENLQLQLEIPLQKLQRHRWFAVQVEADTDQGYATTATEVGFL